MDQLSEKVILVTTFAVFLILVAIGIIILVVIYQRKKIQYARENQQLQSQFQEELLRAQLEIQEQTFKTISQELHDNIGQTLGLAKLNLNTVDWNNGGRAAEKIADAKNLVGKAIQDLRDLSKTLNTDVIAAAGLLNAIEAELQVVEKTGVLKTSFHLSGASVKLDAQKELILFRIVQEALHNVIRHAQASQVSVSAGCHNDLFRLSIEDDGCGFEETARPVLGSGLRNMQSRSQLIGASWRIDSRKNEGTTVHITLPTNA